MKKQLQSRSLIRCLMRITLIQFILSVTLISLSFAEEAHSQQLLTKRLDFKVQNQSLKSTIRELEKLSDSRFIYSNSLINTDNKISLELYNTLFTDVLHKILSPLDITYTISGNQVVLQKRKGIFKPLKGKYGDHLLLQREDIKLTGAVKDEKGEPLTGVSVLLKGTPKGLTTDINGQFEIAVPGPESILQFSLVGYQTHERRVGNSTHLDIVLELDNKILEEVVVVGYGSQRRSTVTGAIATANLEAVKNAPNTNIIQALQGNVPGLNVGPVTQAGSTPTLSIRGQNTISGNQNVLIILDGIQYNNSLSSINPDDIASIEVLKDASSTAVYGAQAANGVLLITSRKGAKGEKARISYTSSIATQSPSGNVRPMNREEYLDKVRDLFWDQAYLAPDYTQPNPNFNIANHVHISVREGGNLVPTRFNWWDEGTNKGYILDNQLSISGATDKVNYLISGAYTDQKGFIMNDLFKRKTLRVNLETQATDWLRVGVQSFGSFVNADGAEPTVSALFMMSPMLTPYFENGDLNPFPFNSVDPNPFLTYDVTDRERHNYYFANIYSDIRLPFVKGLNYRINFGNNGRNTQRYNASKYGGGLTGTAGKTNEGYYDYTLDNILTYEKFFDKHGITATLLYGATQRKQETTTATGTGFTRLTLGYDDLSQATIQRTSSGGYEESLNYQMARLNYSYDRRYLVTGTIRRDGFSAFAKNNKWGIFPSVSLGWVVSEEKFFENIQNINFLKLRAGYGISGNQISRYSSLDIVGTQPAYVFGDGGATVFGQSINSLANPDLRWERTREINVGTDFVVWKGRLSGSFDFYSRNTNDLLFSVQIPTITGFSSITTNVGEVGNKGFELSLTSQNIKLGDLAWSTTLNVSHNRSRIIELLGSGDLVASGLFIGERFGSIYGYKTDGIYQIGDEIPAGYSAGTYRVTDLNGDGIVNPNDRYVLGSEEPAYRFSIINTLKFKGLSLSFLVNSIQGGKDGYLGSNSPSTGRTDVSIRNGDIAGINYWTPANPTGTAALWTGAGPTINPAIHYSRSFVRLQDITLSYKVPESITDKARMQNLSLFVSGKNLKTWTSWKGWDPETGAGLVRGGRPLLVGVSAGINVTF